MMLAAYSAQVYDGLLSFHEARGRLRKHLADLNELGPIVCRYGLQDTVGVVLIHKHFDLAENERLVEEVRETELSLAPSREENITPYLWKVEQDRTTGQWQWFPIEYVHNTATSRRAAELAETVSQNQGFLAELGAKFVELGLTDLIGFNTLHRDAIQASPGELLIETNDEATRTLRVAVYPVSVGTEEISPTYWRFEKGAEPEIEHEFLRRYQGEAIEPSANGQAVPDVLVLAFQKILSPSFPALYRRVGLRCLAVREAVDRDLRSEPLDVLVARFRQRRSLRSETRFRAWLQQRCMTRDELASSLRERDRERRLLALYEGLYPEARGPAGLFRRLIADLAARAGTGRGSPRRPHLLRFGMYWDSPLVRELKFRGEFKPAMEAAGRIVRCNAEFFDRDPGLAASLLPESLLDGWFAERWGIDPARLDTAIADRGFPKHADFTEAARYVYVYERRRGAWAAGELAGGQGNGA